MAKMVSCERFLLLAPPRLRFLEDQGLVRNQSKEIAKPMYATLVYEGQNVGLVFDFDYRRQDVGAQVLEVEGPEADGENHRYANDLYSYLMDFHGYRGGFGPPSAGYGLEASESKIVEDIDSWIYLLRNFGQRLINDDPSCFLVKK